MAKNIKLPEKKKSKLADAAARVAQKKTEQHRQQSSERRQVTEDLSPAAVNRRNYLRSQGIDLMAQRQERRDQREQARMEAARMLAGTAMAAGARREATAVRADAMEAASMLAGTSMAAGARREATALRADAQGRKLAHDASTTGRLPEGYRWYRQGDRSIAVRDFAHKPLDGVSNTILQYYGAAQQANEQYGKQYGQTKAELDDLTASYEYAKQVVERGNADPAYADAHPEYYLLTGDDPNQNLSGYEKLVAQKQQELDRLNTEFSKVDTLRPADMEGMTVRDSARMQGAYYQRPSVWNDPILSPVIDTVDGAYQMMTGGQSLKSIAQEEAQNGKEGIGFLRGLGAGAVMGGNQLNDTLLGIAENAVDLTGSWLGKKIDPNWENPITKLREGNQRLGYAAYGDELENATGAERVLMNVTASGLNSAAHMAMGGMMGKGLGMLGGGGTMPTAMQAARAQGMTGFGNMGSFTLGAMTDAYDRAEADGSPAYMRPIRAIAAGMGSMIANSDNTEKFMQRMGIGAGMDKTGISNFVGTKMYSKWGDAAMNWAADTFGDQALSEGTQEVVEKIIDRTLDAGFTGNLLNAEYWDGFADELGEDFFYGYLSGALYNTMALPNYAPSNQMLNGMVTGETETTPETMVRWFEQVATDMADPEMQRIAQQATQEMQHAGSVEAAQNGVVERMLTAADALVAKQEQKAAAEAAVPEIQADEEGVSRFDRPMAATVIDAEDGSGEVQVVGFETTQDGRNIVLHTVDAQGNHGTAMTGELNFADATVQQLMTADDAKNLSGESLQSYLRDYASEVDGHSVTPEEYARGYGMVYRRAAAGMDMADAIRNSVIPQVMTQSAMQDAYASGLGAGAATQESITHSPTSATNGVMNRSFTTGAWNSMTRQQQRVAAANMEVVSALAKRMGATINIVDSITDGSGNKANGRYNAKTGQIDIALNADANAYAYVAMHELTHQLKDQHSDSWSTFSGWVQEALTDKGQNFEKLVKYQMDSFGLSREDAAEEVICNTVPAMLQDEGTLQKLYEQDRTLFEKLMDWLKNLISDVKAAGKALSERSQSWKQMGALKEDAATLQGLYDVMESIMQSEGEAASGNSGTKSSPKTASFAEHKLFSGLVDKLRQLNPDSYITVGTIEKGSPLEQVGIPNGKLYFDVSKALKELDKHGDHLSEKVYKEIPSLLANPIAITQYKDNTVSVYGHLIHNGTTPIVVGVMIAKDRSGTASIAKIRTVHARGDYRRQITDDSVLYLNPNKKETSAWFQALGIRVPLGGKRFGFIRSIAGDTQNVKYSYAGQTAKTADHDMLATARDMRDDGVDNETIRKETGWFVGKDGKWRFEMDDSQSRVKLPESNYNELGDLLENSRILEAYPEMANMKVIFQGLEDGQYGQYDAKFDTIDLAYELKSKPKELRYALLHELQHAIQHRERFATGASVAYWQRRIDEGFDTRTAKQKKAEAKAEDALRRVLEERPEFYHDMMNLRKMLPDVPRGKVDWDTFEQLEEDPVEWQEYDAQRDLLEEKYGVEAMFDFDDLLHDREKAMRNERSATDLYFATSGEIEARNVEGRADLTAKERREKAPMLGDEDTVFARTSAYNATDAAHTPEQLRIMQEYADAIDKRLLEAVSLYASNKYAPNKRLKICDVNQRMAEDVRRLLGIDVQGYTVNIDRSGLNHILKRHGKKGEHDHSMSNSADIARMGYVIENYDHIEILKNQNGEPVYSSSRINREGKPSPVLLLHKRIDGEYYLSEAIVDSSWKKIWVQSAYIKKAGDYATAENGNAPQLTSETPNASLSDNISIAQNNRVDNAKFSLSDYDQDARKAENQMGILLRMTERHHITPGEMAKVASHAINSVASTANKQELARRLAEAFRVSRDGVALMNELVPIAKDVLEQSARVTDEGNERIYPSGMDAQESYEWLANKMFVKYVALATVQVDADNPTAFAVALKGYREAIGAVEKSSHQLFDEAYANVLERFGQKVKRGENYNLSKETATKEGQQLYRRVMEEKRRLWRTKREAGEKRKRVETMIYRQTNQLLKKLEKATDKAHVKDPLQDSVVSFLKGLNFGDKTTTSRSLGSRIRRLKDAMANAQGNSDNQLGYLIDDEMTAKMAEFAEKLEDIDTMDKLDDAALIEVNKMISYVSHVVNNADKAFANKRKETIGAAAGRFLQEAGEREDWKDRGKTVNWARNFLTVGQMDSMHFFDKLGGAAKEMYQSLRDGLDKKTLHRANAMEYVAEAVSKIPAKDQADLVAGKKAKKTRYELTGGSIELTKAQVMELYCLNKREQARGHLYDETVGGIRAGDNQNARAVKVQPKDIDKLTDTLTAQEKALADALQQYMVDECAKWGNETSMVLYGYKKFGEANYYPIRVDPDSVDSNISQEGQQDNLYAIANMGMTKALKEKAKNALYIGDIFDTFSRHVDNMATYNAYAAPVADLVRWYNYRPGDGSSVKKMIQSKWGKEAAEYIPRLIRDLNGEVNRSYSPKWAEKMTGLMKSSSVGRNVRVAIQQPTAILRAGDMMDYRYITAGLTGLTGKGGNVKLRNAIELSKQHCPIALLKSMGFFETDMGKSLRAAMFDNRGVLEKLKDEGMWLPGKMDEMTFGAIWRACEAETRKLKPDLAVGSDAYYEAVGQRMSEIIDYTQVVDTPFHRTQLMRSSDGLTKMATSFMSEPSKTYNMLMSAMQRLKENRHDPVAKRKFCRALGAYGLNAVVNAAAQSLIDAVRNGDDEDFWEKWGKAMFGDWSSCEKFMDYVRTALGSNYISGLNPLSLIPYIKDVLSMIQGYDVKRTDMQSMEKLMQVGTNVGELINGKNKLSGWGWARQIATAVDSVTGQSFANALRDGYSFANLILKAIGLDPISEKTETASTSIAYDNLYDAILDGDAKKWSRVSKRTGTTLKKTEKEIDAAMATHFAKDAAEQVVTAYTAKQAGKASEYNRIRSKFVDEYSEVLGENGSKRAEEIFDKSVAVYANDQESEEEEEETTPLNSKAWSYTEAASVVQGYANGTCSREDIALVRSEMIADSTAKNPQKTVDTSILKQVKKLYIAAGPAERKRLGEAVKELFGKDDKYLANWLK